MNAEGLQDKVLLSIEEVLKHSRKDSCWVIYQDNVYDVTPFLYDHPGGEEILLRHAGQDITKAFDEIGHSPEARAILKNYFIGRLGEVIEAKGVEIGQSNLRLIDRIKQRLFTKEDHFSIHKIFGLGALIGFLVMTCRVLQFDPTLPAFFVKPTWANMLILSCNFGVAISALMFHVPARRFFNHIGTLEHQELRFHSIVFSLRSIAFVLWYMFEPVFILLFPIVESFVWVFRASLLCVWHVLADVATYKYAELNGTTIRGGLTEKNQINLLGASLASIAQLGAILVFLGALETDPLKRSHLADLSYLILMPIQLSVFQMTLKRKGFLSDKLSSWVYMFELGVVAVAIAPGSREMFWLMSFGLLRFILRWNKYLLFFLFAFLAQYALLSINPLVPLALGVVLLALMQKQANIQCFRSFTQVACSLEKKTKVSENTYHLELKLPDGYAYKMPSGRHLALHIDEKTQRFYTPIAYSPDGKKFEILAKTYPNGKANELIGATSIGHQLQFSGPYGNIFCAENKALRVGEEMILLKNKKLLCIAGGSGITPIYSILTNLPPKTNTELIYINQQAKDIFLRDKIENLSHKVDIKYYLTKENSIQESWFKKSRYQPERISADVALICGPPQFCAHYKTLVEELNPATKVFVF